MWEIIGSFCLVIVALLQVAILWHQHKVLLAREDQHRLLDINHQRRHHLFELWPIMTSIIDIHPEHPVPVRELPEISNKLELIAMARLQNLVDAELFDATFKDLFIRYCEMVAMGKDIKDNRGYTYLYQNPFVLELYEKYTEKKLQNWVTSQQTKIS